MDSNSSRIFAFSISKLDWCVVNRIPQGTFQCYSELAGKLNKVEATIELECYRAEARVRKQWEAREDRLAQQLKELQLSKTA